MRLLEIKNIKGTIELLSGLRVGGDSGAIEIGGNDNPIIRNPITKEPYIPGSSIKGKMRSLSEWYLGRVKTGGEVHTCREEHCPICKVYGKSAGDNTTVLGPTRLIVRDSYLTEESRYHLNTLKETKGTDTEMKCENFVNRITSIPTPRNMERVPQGIYFNVEMSYKVFDMDDKGKEDLDNLENVKKALKLLQLDGIGGGVSRGNGHVKIVCEIDGEEIDFDSIEI